MRAPIKSLVKGALTFVPGLPRWLPVRELGSRQSALYCYEVWLKHLVMLWRSGVREIPRVVAELGPGRTFGLGLAALLSGAERYHAFDVVPYVKDPTDLAIFDELVDLFGRRAGRPCPGWPDYGDDLDERGFPGHILTDEVLRVSLAPPRLARIREAMTRPGVAGHPIVIEYVAPWLERAVLGEGVVDLVVSHAVMQHVVDLPGAYQTMAAWLKPGGVMSHQLELTSHRLSPRWNGHYGYGDRTWRIMAGRRAFLLNRQPASKHLALIAAAGCDPICVLKQRGPAGGIDRSQLAPRFRDISDDDLTCQGLFVQAVKRR